MSPMAFQDWLKHRIQHIDATLDAWLPAGDSGAGTLHQAMRYAVLGGGKRLRPVLTIATAELFNVPLEQALPPAVAIELIHAYSLIHDDLPAMDDDDLRRGRPTCHKAFDEATAILAGDALQCLAFEWLATQGHYAAPTRVAMLRALAQASGHAGMVGGQALDLAAVGHHPDLAALELMHQHKTGALIACSVQLGALSAGEMAHEAMGPLRDFTAAIGLAFQVQDDILDVEGDTQTLGKRQGADAARDKPTYSSLLGLEGARALLHRLRDQAYHALGRLPQDTTRLRALADFVIDRNH